jgi:hypothetical protein
MATRLIQVPPPESPVKSWGRSKVQRRPAGEYPAFFGGSWHPLVKEAYPDAKAVLSFADAHVAFVKIYWDGVPGSQPRNYEPPAKYDYNWDGE